jgi:hypothetical protein
LLPLALTPCSLLSSTYIFRGTGPTTLLGDVVLLPRRRDVPPSYSYPSLKNAFADELSSISQSLLYSTFDRACLLHLVDSNTVIPCACPQGTSDLLSFPLHPRDFPVRLESLRPCRSLNALVFARCKGTSDLLSFPLLRDFCLPIYRCRQSYLPVFVVRWSALVCSELSSSQCLLYTLISTALTIQT